MEVKIKEYTLDYAGCTECDCRHTECRVEYHPEKVVKDAWCSDCGEPVWGAFDRSMIGHSVECVE